uniref:Outer membrane protein assembly factor BamB n=1 Tax=Candidatus Kentrum sp. MB TaxID=2138164 RepID=A0A450WYW1_9GAMM|nr:MAG: Beta-barrel assembly machine subunit BamB [Candidatus Kentron sp. MB]VFK32628.1 MAG: Beta-barrel assembly machine subunit BamB [Candidatus Kentron sp. MB]VFK76005.1 MAG: Beta-barrel assembly machine subunit BamB [Candidatus Kentron sp. MB]
MRQSLFPSPSFFSVASIRLCYPLHFLSYPTASRFSRVSPRAIGPWLMIMTMMALVVSLSGCGNWNFMKKKETKTPATALVAFKPEVRLEKLWRENVGDNNDDPYVRLFPVVRDNRLFVADMEGNVRAYDARTGDALWKTDLKLPIRGGPGLGGNIVLVGTNDGEVVALSQEDGRLLWKARVSSEVLAMPRERYGIVVVRTVDGKLFGLDAEDGKQRWVYERSVPVLSLRGTSAPVFSRNVVAAGFDGGQLVAILLKEGIPVWETRIALPRGRFEIERMVDIDGELMVAGPIIYVVTFRGHVAAVDIRSGGTFWRREMSSHAGLGILGMSLYITDDKSHLWALDRRSGEPLWQKTELAHRELTAPVGFSPVGFGDYVAVGDSEGYLHLLDAGDGRMVGRIRADKDGITSPPIVGGETDDILYVYGRGGTLTAFRIRE